MIIESILGFISKPLDTVLKAFLPDKKQQDKFKHELNKLLLTLPFKEREMFEKRLQIEAQHPNLLRDAVRPIITYCAWAWYMTYKSIVLYIITKAYLPMLIKLSTGEAETIYKNVGKINELLREYASHIFTTADLYILLTILGFWFGSKMLERVVDKYAKTGGIFSMFGMKQSKNPPTITNEDTTDY